MARHEPPANSTRETPKPRRASQKHADFDLSEAVRFANDLGMGQKRTRRIRHDGGAMTNQQQRVACEQGASSPSHFGAKSVAGTTCPWIQACLDDCVARRIREICGDPGTRPRTIEGVEQGQKRGRRLAWCCGRKRTLTRSARFYVVTFPGRRRGRNQRHGGGRREGAGRDRSRSRLAFVRRRPDPGGAMVPAVRDGIGESRDRRVNARVERTFIWHIGRSADCGRLACNRWRTSIASGFTYLPLATLSPEMDDLLRMRRLFGLRSPVNTVAGCLNPGDAAAGVDGVFHPPYIAVHLGVAERLGRPRLVVLKGGGGEAERVPLKPATGWLWDLSRAESEVALPAWPVCRR